jgi:3-deoxy-D-manno-octulosonate 8-phosphate phosphatase (KDO 8-P phosphatase)
MSIKLFVMDVDGTMTDGHIYIGATGEMMKAFDVKDGYAIYHMLPAHDIIPVIVTGRSSDIVEARAKELKITELHQGVSDKLAVLASLAAAYNITPDQIAYIGDDLNDLDAMSYCGFTACPADAVDAVRKAAKYVCKANGGRGAVREFVEYLLSLS